MKKGWIVAIIIAVIVAIILILILLEKNPTPEELRCKTDSDCELIEICCSCEEGGTRAAIAKDHKEKIMEILAVNCNSENSLSCNGTVLNVPNCGEWIYAKCWDGWCSTSNQNPREFIIYGNWSYSK